MTQPYLLKLDKFYYDAFYDTFCDTFVGTQPTCSKISSESALKDYSIFEAPVT